MPLLKQEVDYNNKIPNNNYDSIIEKNITNGNTNNKIKQFNNNSNVKNKDDSYNKQIFTNMKSKLKFDEDSVQNVNEKSTNNDSNINITLNNEGN